MKRDYLNTNLLLQLKDGNMVAFDTVYARYCKRLYGFVLRYIKTETDAEEIVQEVFLKLWMSRSKIDIYSSFESFLFTIAYNTTISLLRKKLNEKKYIDHIESIQNIESADVVINDLQFNELNVKVQQLLNKLTPRQKEIFQLSREEGLTHNEIAKKLNISVNTVKNHMVSTLSFLKSNMDNNLIVSSLFICLFI